MIASVSRIATWAQSAQAELEELAQESRKEALFMEAISAALDATEGERARLLASTAYRQARRAKRLMSWTKAIIATCHNITQLIAWYAGWVDEDGNPLDQPKG